MNALNKIMISGLLALAFTACGSGSSSQSQPTIPVTPTTQVPAFTNQTQCANQVQNVGQIGIPGNTACPYKGAFNAQIGYQGYAFHFEAGVGFRIDFGWDYNDMCPQIGQRPIFQNGSFSHCTNVNPLFAQYDEYGSQPNTGECTGDQLNPGVTGCRAQLRPMQAPANYTAPPVQQLNPVVINPVVNI